MTFTGLLNLDGANKSTVFVSGNVIPAHNHCS